MQISTSRYLRWLLILSSCLISVYLHHAALRLHLPPGITASIVWLFSIVLVLMAARNATDEIPKEIPYIGTLSLLVLMGAVGIGTVLRLSLFDSQGLMFDEAYVLREAFAIRSGIRLTPIWIIGDQPSNLSAWPVAFFLMFLENIKWATRLPNIFYSLATAYFMFRLLREFFNERTAVLGVLLVMFSIWDIHTSRYNEFNVTNIPFLVSGTTYFLYRSLFNRSPWEMALCGLFLGICVTTLYTAAVMFGVVVASVSAFWILYRTERSILQRRCFWLVASFVVVTAPTVVKVIDYPAPSVGRHRSFIEENYRNSGYLAQASRLVKDFWEAADGPYDAYLWRIRLDRVSWILFFAGLLYCVRNVRDKRLIPILFGLFFYSLLLILLHRGTSDWREQGFLFFILLIAALGASYAMEIVRLKSNGFAMVGVCVLISVSASLTYLEYLKIFTGNRLANSCEMIAKRLKPYVDEGYRISIPAGFAHWVIPPQLPKGTRVRWYKDPKREISLIRLNDKVVIADVVHSGTVQPFAVENAAANLESEHELSIVYDEQGNYRGKILSIPPLAGKDVQRELPPSGTQRNESKM